MESEIDELAMVDRGDEQRWTQSTATRLASDDILAVFAGLPDAPRAIAVYDATPAYSVDPYKAKLTPCFEHIYNEDGTCHAFDCIAPGLILAYDEFSPEIAQWFCGMHWSSSEGAELLTVAEDRRKPMAAFFGGTYEVRESSPGVFTHTWAAPLSTAFKATGTLEVASGTDKHTWTTPPLGSPGQDVTIDHMTLSWSLDGKPLFEVLGTINKRAAQIYEKAIAQRARLHRQRQRARERTRRQHRAAFRRRKRGLA